jgi:hypothetical protein
MNRKNFPCLTKSSVGLLYLIMTAMLLIPSSARAGEPEAVASTESLLKTIAQQESREKVLQAYKDLFAAFDETERRTYLTDSNDGLAVYAAWQRFKLHGFREAKPDRLPISQAVQRLVGFLEGRLHVSVPKPWEDGCVKSKGNDDGSVYFPQVLDMKFEQSPSGYRVAPGDQADLKAEMLVLKSGDDTCELPVKILQHMDKAVVCNLAFLITPDYCYLAEYDRSIGFSYPLTCFHRRKEEALWTTTVWANQTSIVQGQGLHWAKLVLQPERIFVFGSSGIEQYVEAFDLADGKNRLRMWFD